MAFSRSRPSNKHPDRLWASVVAALVLSLAVSAGAADLCLAVGEFTAGGGHASGDSYDLIGTIADPNAGSAHGDGLVLSGGVLAAQPDASAVFADGFEGQTTDQWTSSTGELSP